MNATQYEEMLSLLQNIATRIERVENRLAAIEGAAAAAPAHTPTPGASQGFSSDNAIADDADLDGPYGNPEIRFDPRRWTGQTFVGAKFSDAPPEYLDTLAGYLDWKANEAEKKGELAKNGKPRSAYLRKDAARARGWRKRALERGTRKAAPVARPRPAPGDELDPDMPF